MEELIIGTKEMVNPDIPVTKLTDDPVKQEAIIALRDFIQEQWPGLRVNYKDYDRAYFYWGPTEFYCIDAVSPLMGLTYNDRWVFDDDRQINKNVPEIMYLCNLIDDIQMPAE